MSFRILHIIDSGGLYGAERVLLGLASECSKRADEVFVGTIVAPQDAGDPLGDASTAAGLRHVQFLMNDGLNFGGVKAILRFARDQRIDIIHSHGYKANILLGLTPRRYRFSSLVCTLHGWTSNGRLGRLSSYEWLEKRILSRFDRVVVVSEKMRDALGHRRLDGKLTLIGNGVQVCNDAVQLDAEEGVGNREFTEKVWRILAAGRLSHEKGFDLLLEAIGKLKLRGIRLHLIIAGEGPERLSLERQIAQNSLQNDVDLVGFQEDIAPFFGQADLFVLSSRTEGLPLVLLEAMVWGVPVVATPVGEVPKVLGNNECGWLAHGLSPDALAETMQNVIGCDWQERALARDRARDRVCRHYSLASMAERYRSLYHHAVNGGR